MKKAIAFILVALIVFSFVAACASDFAPARAPAASPTPPAAESPGFAAGEMDIEFFYGDQLSDSESPFALTGQGGGGFAERIIFTVYADIETTEFDQTIEDVHEMLRLNGGFIESSFVSGITQWQMRLGHPPRRTANFTLRVPQARLAAMTADLEYLGNVVSRRNEAVNITAQFVDTESRLTALRIQEERLLYMLSLADNVADMIIIEQSLSEVRMRIESMTATLRNWENQINFSTLTLNIFEVEEYTELIPINRTYWQQISDGLAWTFRDIGRFFMNLFSWFIINLPVLIILAVIVFAVQLFVRRKIKKMRGRKNMPTEGADNDGQS